MKPASCLTESGGDRPPSIHGTARIAGYARRVAHGCWSPTDWSPMPRTRTSPPGPPTTLHELHARRDALRDEIAEAEASQAWERAAGLRLHAEVLGASEPALRRAAVFDEIDEAERVASLADSEAQRVHAEARAVRELIAQQTDRLRRLLVEAGSHEGRAGTMRARAHELRSEIR